jgi:hypothetical protein
MESHIDEGLQIIIRSVVNIQQIHEVGIIKPLNRESNGGTFQSKLGCIEVLPCVFHPITSGSKTAIGFKGKFPARTARVDISLYIFHGTLNRITSRGVSVVVAHNAVEMVNELGD